MSGLPQSKRFGRLNDYSATRPFVQSELINKQEESTPGMTSLGPRAASNLKEVADQRESVAAEEALPPKLEETQILKSLEAKETAVRAQGSQASAAELDGQRSRMNPSALEAVDEIRRLQEQIERSSAADDEKPSASADAVESKGVGISRTASPQPTILGRPLEKMSAHRRATSLDPDILVFYEAFVERKPSSRCPITSKTIDLAE